MGCCGSAFSQKRIPVEITRISDSREVKRFTFINVKLIKDREELLNINFDELNDTTKLTILDTISVTGNTSLRYEINYTIAPIDINSMTTFLKDSLDFFVSGNEIKLVLNSYFDFISNSSRKLRSMTAVKFFDGRHMAKLIPRQNSINESYFNLVNISESKLYGTGMGNEFWSDLYIYSNETWEKPPMSLMALCGNFGQQPLNINDTTHATIIGIPNFPNGKPFELIPANYKLTNTFAESPEGTIIPSRNIGKRIYTYYQVSKEFEIK